MSNHEGNIIPLSERFNEGNEDIRYSNRYWHTGMSDAEVTQIERLAKHELPITDNYIDNITKWLYNTKKGKTYFALYSTQDEENPTVLYASKDKQASYDYAVIENFVNILKEMEVYHNGKTRGIDERPRTFDAILNRIGDTNGLHNIHSGKPLERGTYNGNVSVYSGASRGKLPQALLNCMQDCFERRENESIKRELNVLNGDEMHQDREISRGKLTQERIDYLIDYYGAGNKVDYARAWVASISPTDFIDLTVWSMDITDSMKESVLFDGQIMYQARQYNIDEHPLDKYNGINIPNHEKWRIGQALNEKYRDDMEFPQYVFLSIFNNKLGIDNQYCVRWYGFDDFEVIARGGKRLEKFRRILEDIKRREKDSYVDECLDEFENFRRKHNRDTLDVGDGREHRRDDSLLGQHTNSYRGEGSESIDISDERGETKRQDREISRGKLTQDRAVSNREILVDAIPRYARATFVRKNLVS